MITLNLPFPPSVNHYWRYTNGKVLVSHRGRQYREAVKLACLKIKSPMEGPLKVHLRAFPPDQRRRDLDNLNKAILDAMQAGGVYHDDSQIADLRIVRAHTEKPGWIQAEITPLEIAYAK